MNKMQKELSSWIFPVILYFILPEVGRFFIIFKIFTTVLKALKSKSSINNTTSSEQSTSQFNDIKPHDIDFSHDHSYNDNPTYGSKRKRSKTNTFDTEINVRCPVCNADNFINKIPTECEYCGSKIVKI